MQATEGISALGPYPALQMMAGAAVVIASIYVMLRAHKDKREAVPPPAPMQAEMQVFMQGPLVAALNCIREQVETTKRNEALLREILEELRWMNRVLSQAAPTRPDRAGR